MIFFQPQLFCPNGNLIMLLKIDGLKTYFDGGQEPVKAVENLSLTLREGETLGLVGESGSGKSVTSLTIMRLLPDVSASIAGGSISYLGRDLVKLSEAEMRDIRGDEIGMIFQEPGTSLNPVMRVGWQVMEAVLQHQKVTREEARKRTTCFAKSAFPIRNAAWTAIHTKCRAGRSSGS